MWLLKSRSLLIKNIVQCWGWEIRTASHMDVLCKHSWCIIQYYVPFCEFRTAVYMAYWSLAGMSQHNTGFSVYSVISVLKLYTSDPGENEDMWNTFQRLALVVRLLAEHNCAFQSGGERVQRIFSFLHFRVQQQLQFSVLCRFFF